MKSSPVKPPVCPYCGKRSRLVDSSEVYGTSYGMVWACHPCKAWVGCHNNSKRHVPLGRLANAELRKAKRAAHAAFDRLWIAKMNRDNCTRMIARAAGYRWLGEQLGTSAKETHIGMFDVEQCARVVEICTKIGRKPVERKEASP